MAGGSGNSPLYVAARPPTDPAQLSAYLTEELQRIQRALQQLAAGHIDTTYVAPPRPREGDIRLADGVHWDPVAAGAPRFVGYADGAWRLLG
jgi:hypothetical protein